MPEDEKPIRTDAEILVYENAFARIFDNFVTFPGETKGRYLKVDWRAPHGVAVLPVLTTGEIFFVRPFRYALNDWSIEIPQGFGSADMSSEQSAQAELSQETGLRCELLNRLIALRSDAATTDLAVHIYMASGCAPKDSPTPEETEVFGAPLVLKLHDALDLVARGKIVDSITVSALLFYALPRLS